MNSARAILAFASADISDDDADHCGTVTNYCAVDANQPIARRSSLGSATSVRADRLIDAWIVGGGVVPQAFKYGCPQRQRWRQLQSVSDQNQSVSKRFLGSQL